MQRRDRAPGRIIEQGRADTLHDTEPKLHRVVKEGLVTAHRLALVVHEGPAAGNPARIDLGAARRERARLRLDLLLNRAPEAVRVIHVDMSLRDLPLLQVAHMRLT